MSYWKYGVIEKECPFSSEKYFELHEIYFNDDGSIYAFTENPVTLFGDSKEDVEKVLQMMLKDVQKGKVFKYNELLKQIEQNKGK